MIFITGATGLVGGNLVRALLEAGKSVRALVHTDRRALDGLDVETVQGDVRDPEGIAGAMKGAEVVYHLAGEISLEMNSWPKVEAINVLGTRNVVEACLRCGVRRLVHFSSIHAIEQAPFDSPVDEDRPLVDATQAGASNIRIPPYDRSKASGERAVQAGIARGLDAVILNPTGILGPNDFRPSYLGEALVLLARGKIPALVSGGFDWVDVRDVVRGAMLAEQMATRGKRYLLAGHWLSVREIAELVAQVMGRRPPLFTVPMKLAEMTAVPMGWLARFHGSHPIYTRVTLHALRSNRRISRARAEQELGYTSRPTAETVRDTIGWFTAHGYIPG